MSSVTTHTGRNHAAGPRLGAMAARACRGACPRRGQPLLRGMVRAAASGGTVGGSGRDQVAETRTVTPAPAGILGRRPSRSRSRLRLAVPMLLALAVQCSRVLGRLRLLWSFLPWGSGCLTGLRVLLANQKANGRSGVRRPGRCLAGSTRHRGDFIASPGHCHWHSAVHAHWHSRTSIDRMTNPAY